MATRQWKWLAWYPLTDEKIQRNRPIAVQRIKEHITPHFATFYCPSLHYPPLHYTTLPCTTSECTTPHYTKSQSTPLHHMTLYYAPLHSTPLHYSRLLYPIHYTTLHYSRLHSTPLHHIIPDYITSHRIASQFGPLRNHTHSTAPADRWGRVLQLSLPVISTGKQTGDLPVNFGYI